MTIKIIDTTGAIIPAIRPVELLLLSLLSDEEWS